MNGRDQRLLESLKRSLSKNVKREKIRLVDQGFRLEQNSKLRGALEHAWYQILFDRISQQDREMGVIYGGD